MTRVYPRHLGIGWIPWTFLQLIKYTQDPSKCYVLGEKSNRLKIAF